MSRIWWATLFGLLLGALFFAMMQRGCDAGAEFDGERVADLAPFADPDLLVLERAPENLAPLTIDAATPNLGRRESPTRVAPAVVPEPFRPSDGTVTRGKTREEPRRVCQRAVRNRSASSTGCGSCARSRQRRSRELSLQLARESGQLRPDQEDRVVTRNLTPSVLEAQRNFRQQLSTSSAYRSGRSGGPDAAGGGGGGETGVDGESGGEGDGDGLSDLLDDLGVDIPADALQALQDLGGVPGGNGDTGRGLGGSSGPAVDRTETLFSQGGALLDTIIPVARWESVAQGRTADGRDVTSADLYLGFATRPTVPVLSSRAEDGLKAPGGGFFTGLVESAVISAGSTGAELVLDQRLDSFVTVGGGVAFFIPGSVSDPAAWGEEIVAEWATTDFSGFRVIEPDADRFGDERFYLWVGRFAAPAGTESVSGTLGVTWLDLASFTSLQADVDVPNCADCWLEGPPEPEPDPDDPDPTNPGESPDPEVPDGANPGLVIDSVTMSPNRLLAGQVSTATVRLAGPAPVGGAKIAVTVSEPGLLSTVSEVVVREGADSTTFVLLAREPEVTTSVRVTLTIGERAVTRVVTVAVPGVELDRLSLRPQQVLGGMGVFGTLRLAEPAGELGEVVEISSSSTRVRPPATVMVPAGSSSVRFDIQTFAVESDTRVTLTARSGASERSAELVLKAEVFGDITRDGVVDGLDLAALLLATMEFDAAADLNDDGVVDLVDLEILVDLLESAGGVGGQPGTDLPVVSRWEAVAISGCDGELAGFRSADLYLGFMDLPTIVGVTSSEAIGLRIENGVFYQHELGSNRPPTAGMLSVLPCAAYDSYLTVGETNPFFTPSFPEPNSADWGTALVTEFLNGIGQTITAVRDESRFGDDRYYVRIGRFTVPVGTRFLGGTLETISIRGEGGMLFDDDVTVYHCASCWGQFDLNSDGVVSDFDVEIMIGLLGEPHEMADPGWGWGC